MEILGILALIGVSAAAGAAGARERFRALRPARERALARQIEALRAALEITHQAWQARTAMHEQAQQVRREHHDGEQGDGER